MVPENDIKLIKATKRGGSVMVTLTGLAEAGQRYLAEKKGDKIVLTPTKKAASRE